MATLTRANQTITVPDDTVPGYLADGWARADLAPGTRPKTKKRRRRGRPAAAVVVDEAAQPPTDAPAAP